MKTAKIILPALALIFSSAIYFILSSQYNFVQDDSYISFRYAENLANGNGLVFNPGENVEGYTSFLWVIILTFLKLLNLDLELWSQILSFVYGLGIILLTYPIARKLIPPTGNNYIDIIICLLPSYLIAITGGFVYWAISGMEATLFVFLLLLGILSLLKKSELEKPNYFGIVVFILACLTRPEGFYFLLFYFFCRFVETGKIFVSQNPIISKELFAAFLPLFLFFLFRLIYYGYPLPNTFYAKAGISSFYLRRGWEYFGDFANSNLLYGLLLFLPLIFLKGKKNYSAQLWQYFSVLGYIVAVIFIGGDVLPLHRLFLPVLPVIYILFIASIIYIVGVLSKIGVKNVIYGIVAFLIFIMGYINFKSEQPRLNDIHATELGLVSKMKTYARWIKKQQETDKNQITVALSTIGAFGYFSNTKIIDLLGLTNEYIAHNHAEMKGVSEPATRKWVERTYNAEYVLSQKPDYIIFPAGAKASAFPESALFVSPLFKYYYYPQLITAENSGELLTVYTFRNRSSEVFYPKLTQQCENNASINFIEASNAFLKYSRTRDESLISEILSKTDSALILCPLNKDDIFELKGMLYYFMGELNKSKHLFNEAINIDKMNSASYLYLINIYLKQDSSRKAYKYLRKLKKLSPDLYPQFTLQ